MPAPFARHLLVCSGLALAIVAVPVRASNNPINGLANAICAAQDLTAVDAAVAAISPDDPLSPEQIAEAFGVATFLADLGRCANRQAIADGFAVYKKDKEVAHLDAAFASGRVAAKPEGDGRSTVPAAVFQGSFASLGTAGDPPSGQ
jgi:hypothetical protein